MATINKKKIFSFIALLIFLVGGFILLSRPSKNLTLEIIQPPKIVGEVDVIKYVSIGGQKIKVDLANTKETRAKGLSLRPSLNEGTGMLFVFEQSDKYGFWMKDMNFPIDIIWLAVPQSGDKQARVVYIKKDAKPSSYPEVFTPSEDAKYVLEVVSGFSEKYNLKIGDSVEFLYQ